MDSTLGAVLRSMSMCRHLLSDGAGGSDDENVGEREARQEPAQCALQSVPVVMDCHVLLPSNSLNLAREGLEGGDLRPHPGWFLVGCRFGERCGCACLNLDVKRRRYPAGRCLCYGEISHSDSAHAERYRIWPARRGRRGCRRFRVAAAEQANGGAGPEIGKIIQVATAHRAGITVLVHPQHRPSVLQP